jgi:inosose dehydratase
MIWLLKTNDMKSRRQFIKLAGTGMLAGSASSVYGYSVHMVPVEKITVADNFEVGMAGFTFAQLNIEKTIEIMKRVGVNYLSLKDFHMPLNSTQEQINEVIGRFTNAGITVYTVGVIYMRTQESVDQAFKYARMAGVKMIVGAPNVELLQYVEKKIKEYDFRLAIHNHGPDNTLFPNATDIWNHVKDMDPRMGICLDIGHTLRDGQDPAVDILRYKSRIYDLHIKDVDKASREGKTVEMGRGLIDIHGVIAALRRIKYNGKCSLEFEKDMKDPIAGIAESIGYFKGVMACK